MTSFRARVCHWLVTVQWLLFSNDTDFRQNTCNCWNIFQDRHIFVASVWSLLVQAKQFVGKMGLCTSQVIIAIWLAGNIVSSIVIRVGHYTPWQASYYAVLCTCVCWWLCQDAKVMSWWDYGYQITAMANRTILVDNNTWNNTHISRVGQVNLCSMFIMQCVPWTMWQFFVAVIFWYDILTDLDKFCIVFTYSHQVEHFRLTLKVYMDYLLNASSEPVVKAGTLYYQYCNWTHAVH